jgi:hypothetical protein
MADAAIWSAELSSANVTALYNAGRPLDINTYFSSDLEAWYRFNPWTRKDPSGLSNVGDTHSTIINQIGTADTTGTPSNVKLSRFSPNSVDGLNILLNNRHGPYGYPSWKQIRGGEHKVLREQRKNSVMSLRNLSIHPDQQGTTRSGDTFTQYIEPVIDTDSVPISHTIVSNNKILDNEGQERVEKQTLTYNSTFGNKVGYFSNVELNNKLNLKIDIDGRGDIYFNRLNGVLMKNATVQGGTNETPFENLDAVYVNYRQKVYPAGYNTFLHRTRTRTQYNTASIWSDSATNRRFSGDVEYKIVGSNLVESERSFTGTPINPTSSFGFTILSQSVWPLDGHLNFTMSLGTSSFDGAGELQNNYTWYAPGAAGGGTSRLSGLLPGPVYTLRSPQLFSGSDLSLPCYRGDAFWAAGNYPYTSGSATGRPNPYQNYEEYAAHMRLVAKDYSIVPEFRISEYMDEYLNSEQEDFLAPIEGIFTLTGASIPNSADDRFFKEYSNSDFMKMFTVVDETYNDQLLVDGKVMKPSQLALRCAAKLKFLPYKGFYPAERTLELARLLSSSYGPSLDQQAFEADGTGGGRTDLASRAWFAPLITPGVLFNSIKSGIAVGSFAVRNTASLHTNGGYPMNRSDAGFASAPMAVSDIGYYSTGCSFFQGEPDDVTPVAIKSDPIPSDGQSYWYGSGSLLFAQNYRPSVEGFANNSRGYYFHPIPWEAIQSPELHMNTKTRGPRDDFYNCFYDHGIGSASIGLTSGEDYRYLNRCFWNGQGRKNYKYAIDNFLCETVNFFTPGVSSFASKRENEFGSAQEKKVYAMRIRLYRTLQDRTTIPSGKAAKVDIRAMADYEKFTMYSRAGAFGPPFAIIDGASAQYQVPTWNHVTPAYFYGMGETILTWTASFDGPPDLGTIFAGMEVTSSRTNEYIAYSDPGAGYAQFGPKNYIAQQLTSSITIKDKVTDVIPGTLTPKARWIIHSKWESPVLNFAHHYREGIEMGRLNGKSSPWNMLGENVQTIGLWHQHGIIPTGSDEGIFIEIDTPPVAVHPSSGEVAYRPESLASLVGMSTGRRRVGRLQQHSRLEEAVVAVPFVVGPDGRRKFYRLPKSQINAAIRVANGLTTTVDRAAETQRLVNLMKKYVFPPRFDFVANKGFVDPFAMYVFEFGVDIDGHDLSNIWQNLPPSVGDKFESQVATIQHPILAKQFFDNDKRKITADIRWLVFKVKKRGRINYDRMIKEQHTTDVSTIPANIEGHYSYNWPYDYFSLVELVKMEAGIQYASHEPEPIVDLGDQEMTMTAATFPGGAPDIVDVDLG